jgi:DNA-binding MurR/RpiR family transcriptional regulator
MTKDASMSDNSAQEELSLEKRIDAALPSLAPAEQKMASFIRAQREVVLLNSAAEIAAKAGTSDATVVRTARSLGFDSLLHLREAILMDLTGSVTTPGGRLRRTLEDLGSDSDGILGHVLKAHRDSLGVMETAEFGEAFRRVIAMLFSARRRHVFGIGPSGSVADYAALQFNRLGLSTTALSASGIGLADHLLAVGEGDVIMMIAYAPIYREVSVILDFAVEQQIPVVLVSDSLGPFVQSQVAEVLPVPRGKANHLSMHGATVVLIEAMIVALATQDRRVALASLEKLGSLRGALDKLWLKRGANK